MLWSNPSRQHSKVLYRWEVRRRGKIGKHGKVIVKRKRRVLAQPPYFLQESGRQSPRVEPFSRGVDRPPDVEENPGSWYRQILDDKRDRWRIPDTFT